jgi:hypothetical protein
LATVLGLLSYSTVLLSTLYRTGLYEEGALIEDVKEDVATPHIPWAKPFAGKPIRALFVGPMYGHRETAELAQRLSLKYDVLFAGTVDKWGQYGAVVGHAKVDDVLGDLRTKLAADLDVVVIGNLEWSLVPDDVVASIFSKVSKGAGFIYVTYSQAFPDNLRRLLDTAPLPNYDAVIPLAPFLALQDRNGHPVLTSKPFTRHFHFGRGRVALIDYPGYRPKGVQYLTQDPYDRMAYEYCQSYLIKNILFASGAESTLQIKSVTSPAEVLWMAADHGKLTATYSSTLSPNDLKGVIVSWAVRNRTADVVAKGAQSMKEPSGHIVIPIPDLPAGIHFADVTVSLNGKVLDWGGTSFPVYSPFHVVDLQNDTVARDGKLGGQVVVGDLPDNAKVIVRLIDNYGREYSNANLPDLKFVEEMKTALMGRPSDAKALWFALPVKDSLTTINTVRSEMWVGDRLSSIYEKEFYVPRYPDLSDFRLGFWGMAERLDRFSYVASLVWNREKELGASFDLVGHVYDNPQFKIEAATGITRSNLSTFPYVDRNSYFGTSRVRSPCLTDPDYLNVKYSNLRSWVGCLRKLGCVGYNLGDESNLSARGVDVCISPTCLATFHSWLKDRYHTVASMNEEWGTKYADWKEVVPPTRAEALKAGNLAPWMDHRVCMSKIMMDYMAKTAAVIKSVDPAARSGPEGIWGSSPYFGFDWQAATRNLDVLIPYEDELLAFTATRSLAGPTTLTGVWQGGYPERALYEGSARYDPWLALLNSMKTVWFYASYDDATQMTNYNALAPDLRLNRAGIWFFEEWNRINKGAGMLVLNSKRGNDGVAVLNSLVSSYMTGAEASNSFMSAILDAGYQYDVVSTEGVEHGALTNFRALILPASVALTPGEAAAIREFVAAGGVVLADVPPGVYDEHGKQLKKSSVADVFGLVAEESNQAAKGAGAKIPETAEVDAGNLGAEGDAMKIAQSFKGFVLAGGKFSDLVKVVGTLNRTPIFVTNQFGKGRAICLNFSLDAYQDARELSDRSFVPAALRKMLGESGLTTDVSVNYENGAQVMAGVQLVTYHFEGGRLLALMRKEFAPSDNPPVTAIMDLGREKHVYEYETGKYLGFKRRLPVSVKIGAPLMLFVLDRQLGKLKVEAPGSVSQGSELRVAVELGQAPFDVIHVSLVDPQGREVTHYTNNHVLRHGRLEVARRLALNEAKGKWIVRVQDVLTSQNKEATFMVQ